MCPYGRGTCFQCGATGHATKDCCAPGKCDEVEHAHFEFECPNQASRPTFAPASTLAVIKGAVNIANLSQNGKATAVTYDRPVNDGKTNSLAATLLADRHTAPTHNTRFGTFGSATTVVTNHVVMKSNSAHIYECEVNYGTVRRRVHAGGTCDAADTVATQTQEMTLEDDHQYREVVKKSEKVRIFFALSELHVLKDAGAWATNHEKLWSLKELSLLPQDGRINDLDFKKPNGRSERISFVQLRLDKNLDFSKGAQSLVGDKDNTRGHHPSELKDALNAIISRHTVTTPSQKSIVSIGLNKFFISKGWIRMGVLNAVRGYYTSVRPGYDNVLLNVSTTTSAFYHPTIVSAFLRSGQKLAKDYGEPASLLKNRSVRFLYKMRAKVATDKQAADVAEHVDPNAEPNRTRTVAGYGYPSSQQQFEMDGKRITVAKYFKSTYGLDLIFPELPAINVGLGPDQQTKLAIKKATHPDTPTAPEDEVLNPRAVWIPAEFLEIMPDQQFGRRLNADHTRDMLNCALHDPATNQALIQEEGLKIIGATRDGVDLGNLNMTVDNRLITIPARFLPVPQIQYRGTVKSPATASWDVESEDKFMEPGKMSHPICVVDMRPSGNPHPHTAQNIALKLAEHLRNHGVTGVGSNVQTHVCDLYSGTSTPEKQLLGAWTALKNPAIVLIILRDDVAKTYALVKRIADCQLGFHTVCITAKKVSGDLQNSTFDYLSLKFNIKLGGRNHALRHGTATSTVPAGRPGQGKGRAKQTPARDPNIFASIRSNTIVIGADVTHPAGGAILGCPSVAAVVASIDTGLSNFPGTMRLQKGRQEIIPELEEMVTERLGVWMRQNRALPGRILFYRDGVGEDQYEEVKRTEIKAVKKAWEDVKKSIKPDDLITVPSQPLQLTFIVCGKRHHVRFYPTKETDTYGDRNGKLGSVTKRLLNGNLHPGLVVDEVIGRPPVNAEDGTFDFFLQSHAALRGTARSCHYVVLENGTNWLALTGDQIQELTHAFCYNYARATKGVSYAAPAYYADRLCDRGNHYLHSYMKNESMHGKPRPGKDNFSEDMETFKKDVLDWVAARPEWRLAAGRKNPWCEAMDKVMFYL